MDTDGQEPADGGGLDAKSHPGEDTPGWKSACRLPGRSGRCDLVPHETQLPVS